MNTMIPPEDDIELYMEMYPFQKDQEHDDFDIAIWLGSGVYTVGPDEQGVLRTWGKFVGTSEQGLHWHWPGPVGNTDVESVTQTRRLEALSLQPELAPAAHRRREQRRHLPQRLGRSRRSSASALELGLRLALAEPLDRPRRRAYRVRWRSPCENVVAFDFLGRSQSGLLGGKERRCEYLDHRSRKRR